MSYCQCACCDKYVYQPLSNLATFDENGEIDDEKQATDSLMYENVIEHTVKKFNANLSWGNAGVLYLALSTTLYIVEINAIANSWICFLAAFLIAVIIAVLYRCCEDVQEIKRELEIEIQTPIVDLAIQETDRDSIEMGIANKNRKEISLCITDIDVEAAVQELKAENIINEEENEKSELSLLDDMESLDIRSRLSFSDEEFSDGGKHEKLRQFSKHLSSAASIAYITLEKNADVLWENMEDLLVGTLAIVASKSFKTSVGVSFIFLFEKATNTSSELVQDLVYALAVTIIGTLIVVNTGIYLDKLTEDINVYVATQHTLNIRAKLIAYATRQRLIKLSNFAISFVMAWGWRDTIQAFAELSGSEKHIILHSWITVLILTGSLAFLFAFNEQFYFIYPRDATVAAAHINSRTRTTVGEVLSSACKFTLGLTWFDAINVSMEDIGNPLAVYWSLVFGALVTSGIMTYYLDKKRLADRVKSGGFCALYARLDMAITGTVRVYTFAPILDFAFWETLSLSAFAWGIAGALAVRNAVKLSTEVLYLKVIGVDAVIDNKHKQYVWILWISSICALLASVLVLTVLSYVVTVAKTQRIKFVRHLRRYSSCRKEKSISISNEAGGKNNL